MAVSTRRLQKELVDIKKEGAPVGESCKIMAWVNV